MNQGSFVYDKDFVMSFKSPTKFSDRESSDEEIERECPNRRRSEIC